MWSLVKRYIRICNIYKVFSTKLYEAKLPEPKPNFLTEQSPPFEFTRVDFAIPIIYKVGKKEEAKAHTVIFTCAVMRAIYQSGKYVMRAEDLRRANNLPCAQRPIKRAKSEEYSCQACRYLQIGSPYQQHNHIGFRNVFSKSTCSVLESYFHFGERCKQECASWEGDIKGVMEWVPDLQLANPCDLGVNCV